MNRRPVVQKAGAAFWVVSAIFMGLTWLGAHGDEAEPICLERDAIAPVELEGVRAEWAGAPVAVDPEEVYVGSGWVKCLGGTAWIEIRYRGPQGRIVKRWRSPQVLAPSDWTYVAAQTAPLTGKSGEQPITGQLALRLVKGHALFKETRFHAVPRSPIMNGDFEMTVDSKGRLPYWDVEDFAGPDLIPGLPPDGAHGGEVASELLNAGEGKASLVVKVPRDWFALTSVHYPVWPWTGGCRVQALARCGAAGEAQLVALWTDSAQRVLAAGNSVPSRKATWETLTVGPVEPPEGAAYLRVVLLARQAAAGTSEDNSVWFDQVKLNMGSKPFMRVVVNQVGYEAQGPKSAVILTNFFPKRGVLGRFLVVTEDNRRIYEEPLACVGRMYGQDNADWGWYCWRADFSAMTSPGTFKIEAHVGEHKARSFPFVIGRDVLFRETAPLNVDFFFVQRCGFEVPGWHKPCHLDGAKLPDGSHRDLTGGWHSAGDYNKLMWEYGDGGACYALVSAAEAAPDVFAHSDRNGDGVPDIIDEAWWGAKFLAKMQVPETGSFLNHIEQGPDRKTWMRWCPPEETTDNVVGTADDPVVTAGEGSSPLAVGAWARLARILRGYGIESDYLERACRLWNYLTAQESRGADPLLLISSVDLYRVAGDHQYLHFSRRQVEVLLETARPDGQLRGGYGDSGDIPAAALAYFAWKMPEDPLSKEIVRCLEKHLPHFLEEADNPFQIMRQKPSPDGYFFDPSSSLGANYQMCSRAWSALSVHRVTRDRRAFEYAIRQLDFLLGKNPYDLCMLEGKGSLNLPRYHHRYCTIAGRERGAVPGAIPNGFVRDMAGEDRPGVDLSTGGRLYPSYRTNEPWLVHNVFYLLAITTLREALADTPP